jgi:hypothetical protein
MRAAAGRSRSEKKSLITNSKPLTELHLHPAQDPQTCQ